MSRSEKVSKLTIRPATSTDAAPIASLGARIFSASFGYSMPAADLQAYISETYTTSLILKSLNDPNQTFRVAIHSSPSGEQLAGFIALRRNSSEPCVDMFPNKVEILRLYVDEQFQGKGVAKALMVEGEEIARKEGSEYVWLGVWEENFKAQRFYAKFGYERKGEHGLVMGECVQTDWILGKRL